MQYSRRLVLRAVGGSLAACGLATVTAASDGPDGKIGSGRRTETGTVDPGDAHFYRHRPKPATTSLEIQLTGPDDADLDLYVTYDGRRPVPKGFDAKSWTTSAGETVTVGERHLGGTLGVLVDAYEGGGDYTLEFRPSTGGDGGSGDGGGDGSDGGGDGGGGDVGGGDGGGSGGDVDLGAVWDLIEWILKQLLG